MEDCNTLISDCIILSCCCQCLILQLVVFIFFQVPRKVARKMKEYAKRKLRKRKKKRSDDDDNDDDYIEEIADRKERVDYDDDGDDEFTMSLRILELEGIGVKELHKWGSCTEEVDKVLGELSSKGEFGFGSFWGRKPETSKCCCNCTSSLTKQHELEFGGDHVVKFHFIELIAPFTSQ